MIHYPIEFLVVSDSSLLIRSLKIECFQWYGWYLTKSKLERRFMLWIERENTYINNILPKIKLGLSSLNEKKAVGETAIREYQ